MSVDERYRLTLGGPNPFEFSSNESYLDALVGVRYRIPLSERWLVSLRGDASFGGTDLMWSTQGTVGWLFGAKRSSAVFIGYRYRYLEYEKADVFEVEKTLSGFGLGVSIGF